MLQYFQSLSGLNLVSTLNRIGVDSLEKVMMLRMESHFLQGVFDMVLRSSTVRALLERDPGC